MHECAIPHLYREGQDEVEGFLSTFPDPETNLQGLVMLGTTVMESKRKLEACQEVNAFDKNDQKFR